MPEPDRFRDIPLERTMWASTAHFQQLLDASLRHEASLETFSVEHKCWRGIIQQQLGDLTEKLAEVHDKVHESASKLCDGPVPLSGNTCCFLKLDEQAGSDQSKEVESEPAPEAPAAEPPSLDVAAADSGEVALALAGDGKDPKPKNDPMALARAVMKNAKFNDSEQSPTPGDQPKDGLHWIQQLVKSHKFEEGMSIVIVFNVLLMSISLQWQGQYFAYELGLRRDDGGWRSAAPLFEFLEVCLNLVYFAELAIRIWTLGRSFFKSGFNIVDAVIVVIGGFENLVLKPAGSSIGLNLSVLRVMRAFRIFRAVRVIHFAEYMSEMRVLVRTLMSSVRGIGWSIFLMTGVISATGVLMVELTVPLLDDESIDIKQRQELWDWFGTFTRSFYTMFECTFTGGWRFYSRPMLDHNSGMWLFWIPYVVCINFAMMRVIAALFLKQTMAIAEVDEERLAMQKMRQKEKFAAVLRQIFADADTSGDGAISKAEFDAMLEEPTVTDSFHALDLELDEVVALFSVLSAEDGDADYEEFLSGAMKMKSSARTIDTVQILHQQLETHRSVCEIHTLHSELHQLFQRLESGRQ